MFASFSLPDVAAVSRRTVLGALVVGVLGLVGCVLLGALLIGIGFGIGLGLGIFNFRLIQRSVVKVGQREDENRRRPLALNTMGRLTVISVIALGLLFASFDLGVGVMAGLAIFQALLLVNVARSMLKMGNGGVDSVLGADPGGPGFDHPALDATVVDVAAAEALEQPASPGDDPGGGA
ncbi:MAG: ATP synthase subunit I [Acidimicrobiales bacterium]